MLCPSFTQCLFLFCFFLLRDSAYYSTESSLSLEAPGGDFPLQTMAMQPDPGEALTMERGRHGGLASMPPKRRLTLDQYHLRRGACS
ncbi:hypothetical protein M440DRAFT_138694 [Trichoderma longibrachiatum ATCC 18648]|uniref:Secreted protein n=1 Tax=Trichoderma longibrachiatum ATCC 18648 TaxID=983965 RepID=A0A2T4BUM3_TRILO|nr:hypothetical protein M440DRAFT_138694 [Trichoderma longibrachiatum ATCC 18648]